MMIEMDTYEALCDEIRKTYNKKNFLSILKGIGVAVIFMFVDAFLLYNIFIEGNFTEEYAIGTTVITVLILDSLPYIFGMLFAYIKDNAVERHKKKLYKYGLVITGIVTILFVVIYISIRAIIFLGGGDFNIGLQMLLGSVEWGSSYDEINAADALTTIIPIATSVISLVVGIVFYVSIEEYYSQLFEQVERLKAESEINVEKLHNELAVELADVWTKFMPNETCPPIKEYDKIIIELINKYKKRQSELYKDIYKKNVNLIYIEAQKTIDKACDIVSEYTALPDQVKSLQYDEDETKELSELNSVDSEALEEIQNIVKTVWEEVE